MEGLEASTRDGADLDTFLGSLEMTLRLHDRGQGDRTRAVQLINKTNQFNLNGRRLTDEEVGAILDRGGALYSASLSDRTGDHGEITALLLDERGTAVSWVMSCRVFQRRVEHVFLMEVLRRHPFGRLQFSETERNRPIQAFLEELDGTASAEGWAFDGEGFAARHRGLADLFEVTSWG
jgi:FkbH-like protein